MSRMLSQTNSSTPGKAAKKGKAEIKWSFRFLKDLILALVITTLQGAALINNIEGHDTIVWRRIFISITNVLEFSIQKVLHHPPRTNLYFATPISRSTSSFVERTKRNPKLNNYNACSSLSEEMLKFL